MGKSLRGIFKMDKNMAQGSSTQMMELNARVLGRMGLEKI